MNKYKVAIVGAGSIGALKPDKYDSPGGQNILTHAHAVFNHPKMELISIIDRDSEKAGEACKKWRSHITSIFPVYDVEFNKIEPEYIDIYIVSSPTETHYEILKQIIKHRPKLVIAEKPFCSSPERAKEIKNLYRKAKIPIAINYTRRYDPLHQKIAGLLRTRGSWIGDVQNCRVIYGRGFRRESSHVLDLMNWFFGDLFHGMILNGEMRTDPLFDYSRGDPTYSACLKYERCPWVFLTAANGREFSIFEIDIVGTEGRLTLVNHGQLCKRYPTIPEPTYGDYLTLSSSPSVREFGNLKRALLYLLDNAVEHLENGAPLKCTIDDALKVHSIYEMLGV